jgi:nucleotide-binding universal stress UspA family protein
MTTEHGILVGVSGPEESTAAMQWASRHSALTGRPVTLVHVLNPVVPPPPPSILMASGSLREAGRQLLKDAVAEYGAIGGECGSVLREGHAASVLTQMSADADAVVLGHRQLSSVRRIITWSTSTATAAHARCPVVAVPTPGPTESTAPEDGTAWVTVGVHEDGAPEAVLRAGFETAAAYGHRLRLVHAWRLDPVYDDMVVARVGDDWRETVAKEIRDAAEPLTAKYPEVAVEVRVEHQWAPDALADLAESSALLVVGRHGHRPLLPDRIGSVARTALHRATCPVMVVPV